MAELLRRDIWTLHEEEGLWNDTVLALALGVGVLKDEDPANPLSWSWRHQTAVHAMQVDPKDGIRHQCQHSSWYFLPWHRMYLWHFEQILRAAIATLDEIDDDVKENWALPYWDYCRQGARRLPPAFQAELLESGKPNPLYEPDEFRNPDVNGNASLSNEQVYSRGWLTKGAFTTSMAGDSFGGPVTDWHHVGGPAGALENTPHGSVHNFVGGKMALFHSAASDAIFWLHHCNIDRIWEVWRNAEPGRSNPADPDWLGERFEFLDVSGKPEPMTPGQVGDTIALGYRYEDIAPPTECLTVRGAGPMTSFDGSRARDRADAEGPELLPQSIGSSGADTILDRGQTEVAIDLVEDDQLSAREGRTGPARILLFVRDIRAPAVPSVGYSVYLVGRRTDDDYFVGNLPLFGLLEAMEDEESHGLEYAFEITDVVNEMTAAEDWKANEAVLRIRPSNAMTAELATDAPNVTIGSFDFAYQ